jgi:hypothetical protein
MLKAFVVEEVGQPEKLLVFALRGVDAKKIGSKSLDWKDWLKLRAERTPEYDVFIDPSKTELYIDFEQNVNDPIN